MLTLTILKLDRDSVVYERHYKLLQRHLFEPLKIISISFKHDSSDIFSVSVIYPANNKHGFEVITIFLDSYGTIYKLEGEINGLHKRDNV